jgi:hypothetical protein
MSAKKEPIAMQNHMKKLIVRPEDTALTLTKKSPLRLLKNATQAFTAGQATTSQLLVVLGL